MIHQFIFAAPKPGMSVAEFQRYWLEVHAVRYASAIPHIRKYLVDVRIPFDGDLGDPPLPHQGIGEIWLENDEQQLASLQSTEFLDGARRDEPTWAAFWQTIVIDTDEAAPAPDFDSDPVKLTTLLKRKPGLPLDRYRQATAVSGPASGDLPGLLGHRHLFARDNAYVFGEPPFDSVEQMWFTDLDALRRAQASLAYADRIRLERNRLVDSRYVYSMTCEEHWIIGPRPREETAADRAAT
ncbi:EthD domain-containing protein [Actinomadura fibrosa]|uniref:EthD domain-containing protein n=1 Tax=Actinomadura fibrosa TaxID=111802 RepID=A0ABW2XGF6_9ACTN|nr:EthD domain-containing protein [Actinomadura fibrosa]